jgi:hypothetical protein
MFPDVASISEIWDELLEEFGSDAEAPQELSEYFEEVANLGLDGD